MLKQISIDELPVPAAARELYFIPLQEDIFTRRDKKQIIAENNVARTVAAISFFSGSALMVSMERHESLESVLQDSLLHDLASIFETVRLMSDGEEYKAMVNNVLLTSGDLVLSMAFLKEDYQFEHPSDPSTIRAYQFSGVCDEQVPEENLLNYLQYECRHNQGTYGIPLGGWKKDEIEVKKIFRNLTHFFRKVCFVGGGEPWRSSHLIVADPISNRE